MFSVRFSCERASRPDPTLLTCSLEANKSFFKKLLENQPATAQSNEFPNLFAPQQTASFRLAAGRSQASCSIQEPQLTEMEVKCRQKLEDEVCDWAFGLAMLAMASGEGFGLFCLFVGRGGDQKPPKNTYIWRRFVG